MVVFRAEEPRARAPVHRRGVRIESTQPGAASAGVVNQERGEQQVARGDVHLSAQQIVGLEAADAIIALDVLDHRLGCNAPSALSENQARPFTTGR